jgi:hypothetical protein
MPASIIIAGPRVVERPSAATNTMLRRATYRTTMLDQYGKPITAAVSWSVGGAPSGVFVVKNTANKIMMGMATVSVDTLCTVDTKINITASAGGVVSSVQVDVALLKPTGISISGPAAIDLGVATTATQTYTAVVRDQLGQLQPWAVKSFSCSPVYCISDYPYKINRVASE